MRTLNEIVASLSAPLDPAIIRNRYGWKNRDGSTQYVDYVEWQDVAALLDEHAPGWSFNITSVQLIHNGVMASADLTIPSVDEDGCLTDTTRSGVGYGSIEQPKEATEYREASKGDADAERATKKAASDALKRAALLFGVAKELYVKSDADRAGAAAPRQQTGSYTTNTAPRTFDPTKMTGGITDPQLKALKTKFQGADVVAATMFNVQRLEDLTKGQASQLMDALKGATAAVAGGPTF